MAHLTDTQLLILSRASQRQDGFVEVPPTLAGAARKRVIEPLVKRGYLKEIPGRRDAPVWRRDEALGPFALVLTKTGADAIGIAPEERQDAQKTPARAGKRPQRSSSNRGSRRQTSQGQAASPRTGTKLAGIIALLRRKNGASIDDLTEATGWLPHTARAALTGLRKRGYAVAAERRKDRKALYRITAMAVEETKRGR